MAGSPGLRISDFIRGHRTEILHEWERLVRGMPQASQLSHLRLLDHLPNLLELIADLTAPGKDLEPTSLGALPETHALHRLDVGFDLESVAREYGLLRRVILRLFDQEGPDAIRLSEMERLDDVVDEAISRAVARYAESRNLLLAGLDRISEAAAGLGSIEGFLPRLLSVFRETSQAVDAAAFWTCEGGRLRLRASVALDDAEAFDFASRIAEGAARAIVAERRPLELPGDRTKEGMEWLLAAGFQTLRGIPLLDVGGGLVGVACMGSRTAPGFSREDKLLFRTTASRASSMIVQAELREKERIARKRAEASLALVRRDLADRQYMNGILAHDLRTPIQTIALSAKQLLRKESLAPEQVHIAHRISEAAERMARMVRDLLDFTRARAGRTLPTAREPTDLRSVCEQALESFQLTDPGRVIFSSARGDCRGIWDPDRLVQMISNLLRNAIQYSSQRDRIAVRLRGMADLVVLSVYNEGPPIPPDVQAGLFEPFRRGRRDGTGLGLGLFIVDQIVRAHGGRIRVRSKPGLETSFTICLPRRPPVERHEGETLLPLR